VREIADIHLPFIAWLDQRGIPFHRNRPDKATTAVKGDPDFLLTWCNRCLYVECKIPGGKLSEDQEKRIAYLRSAGNRVVVAYSLEECVDAAHGILCEAGPRNDEAPASAAEPSDLWIGTIFGKDWVFRGDPSPGSTNFSVRQATPEDVRNLPRK
jgi:hypothetical protein